jgi:hypothetical protein
VVYVDQRLGRRHWVVTIVIRWGRGANFRGEFVC